MRALHVVRVNLELRLRIDLRVVGKQQVAIRLLRVSFLRVFVNDNPSVKYAVRVAAENAIVKLAAAAVRLGVLDKHVIIEMLATRSGKQTVDKAIAAFAIQHRMHIVANDSAA